MISVRVKGGNQTKDYLLKLQNANKNLMKNLDKYGKAGVDALSIATPFRTGLTAGSWVYEIRQEKGRYVLAFNNTHVEKGVNIAIILQYGHPTRNGGWVEGRDYINPAIQPIFDDIANNAWKEIKNV